MFLSMSIDDLTKILQRPWGWILAVVVVLLLWEGGKKWVPALVEWLVRRVRTALAGTRVMHGRALRTYRAKVASRYARLPVLLLTPGKDIDVSTVYVPLQAIGDREGTPAEAYDQIKATDHVVVLGRPGAGKTMLLRHSMLTWARDPSWRRDQRVPVLLELTRCGGDLEESIVRQFAEDGFPKADRFVDRALRDGKLSVLFDGLDEVSAVERGNVVRSLRSFAAKYATCQIVVTCRTAIYQQQLAPEITTSFQVAEFDDHHIRRFLRQWPDIPDDAGVERLLSALRDAPRIMQLARNPLLLTMIAHLYGGRSSAETVLPHSRAEFYKEAVDALLSRLKDDQNQFKGPVKRAVLVRLAAAIQNTAATSTDRRTRSYEDVLSEILSVKDSLNIGDVEGLLDEIVDRSGLLLRIDGGTRYQFAHLSLQEYLAAVAYEQDPDGLLAKYRAAPGDWREVIKLWCGVVSTDCAPLIESVFRIDELLAFECLADAQVVDPTTADRIIEHFQRKVETSMDDDTLLINAFGLVAGDPRPRGRRVFQYLADWADIGVPFVHKALAATKLPEAADVLAGRLDMPSAVRALVSLGDLAVPALVRVRKVTSGPMINWLRVVVDALGAIGTPASALALTRFLMPQGAIAVRAAWHLAELIEDSDVEAALCEAELPDPPASHAWIWAPFSSRTCAQTSHVAGWVAFLCGTSDPTTVPTSTQRIDPRLAIPLLVFGEGRGAWGHMGPLPTLLENKMSTLRERHPSALSTRGLANTETIDQIDDMLHQNLEIDLNEHSLRLYHALDKTLRVNLVARWIGPARELPTRRQDWQRVSDSATTYEYGGSPQFWLALVIYALFGIGTTLGAVALLFSAWPWGSTWLGWVLTIASAAWFLFVISTEISSIEEENPYDILFLLFVGNFVYVFFDSIRHLSQFLRNPLARFLGFIGSTATTVFPLLVGAHYLGWPASMGLTLFVLTVVYALNWHGARLVRAAQNIFAGLLELDETARRRTSVIAT